MTVHPMHTVYWQFYMSTHNDLKARVDAVVDGATVSNGDDTVLSKVDVGTTLSEIYSHLTIDPKDTDLDEKARVRLASHMMRELDADLDRFEVQPAI